MLKGAISRGLGATLLLASVSWADSPAQPAEAPRQQLAAVSEDTLPASPTLQDYLDYAAQHNAGLKAAYLSWQAVDSTRASVEPLPNPRLTYSHFVEPVETRVGPQRQKVEISQMFPWFGVRRSARDVADAKAAAAQHRYESARLALVHVVKQHYYEYHYLHQAIMITQRGIDLLSELEVVVQTRFKTNTAKHSELVRIQVELGRLEDSFLSLQAYRAPLAAKLNATMSRSLDSPLPWPATAPTPRMSLSVDTVMARLQSTSPELKALEQVAVERAAQVRLETKRNYPRIMLGAAVIDTDEAASPSIADSGKDPIIAMVGLDLPIWRGAIRAERKEAEQRSEAANARKQDRTHTLFADIQIAFYHFKDAERKIALYRDNLIPKALESLAVTQQAFGSGNSSFMDVIDSERMLLELELSHQRAAADHMQRLAELEMLAGTPLSNPE
jgi:outer membrane protein, heavy metal efflux system